MEQAPKYQFPLEPITDLEDWPLVNLSRDRDNLLEQLTDITSRDILSTMDSPEDLFILLEKVIYQEKIRLTRNPWAADPEDEKDFWADIKRRVLKAHAGTNEEYDFEEGKKILRDIINRYGNEIAGNFEPGTYKFAKNIVPTLLGWFLKASSVGKSRRKTVYDRVKVTGPIDKIRELSTRGTLIMLPTHSSNLDSLIIGWVIQFMGLPAFTYGAGLNLFGIKLIAYFISRLGAYRVDRRKKNRIYLETLKNYSSLAIQRGAHSLFFPGGTRSRSGIIEKQLKLGLMGTAIEAQRFNYMNFPEESARKVFVLPVNINYHFVLEAEALINQHLKREGKERFLVENDKFSTSYRIAKFIVNFLTTGADMTISFGPITDVFGNEVDDKGTSFDHQGNPVDIKRYFMSDGKITMDKQRDSEYTRMLGEHVVKSYHTHNTVLTSSLLAFVAFECIFKKHETLDLFAVLRLPEDELVIEPEILERNVERLQKVLKEMEQDGQVLLSEEMHLPLDELIKDGLKNLGLFHPKKVLFKKRKMYRSDDAKLLYYYHNRLVGYELEPYVTI